jgi:hypothetical protein
VQLTLWTPVPQSGDNILVDYTFDSSKQTVYAVSRDVTYVQPVAKQNLVDGLRQKYGKETAAGTAQMLRAPANDGEIEVMWWLFNEQGQVVHPGNVDSDKHAPYACPGDYAAPDIVNLYRDLYRKDENNQVRTATFCDSVISLHVNMEGQQSVRVTRTVLIDFALLRRSALALGEFEKGQAQQQHQNEVQKANQAKPNL